MALPLEPLPALTAIVLFGAAAQWLGWRLRLPAILPLLAVGFLIGPITGLVDVDGMFGPLLRPFVSLAVALILFEGGLTLRRSELTGSGAVVRNLVTIGAAVTWFCITAAAHWLAGVPFDLALLVGAILVLTGPTVVVPLVRHIRPSGPVGPILRWEGILIDPIGALLALVVFDAIVAEQHSVWHVLGSVLLTLGIGGALGAAAALLLGRALTRHWLSDRLQVPASLATVFTVFTVANQLQHESGLAAVTVLGIVLANQRDVDSQRIAEFKEDLTTVLLALLFVVLSARLQMDELTGLGWTHAIVVAIAIAVARPLAVLASTIGTGLQRPHRLFLMALAPRGIVAAAVSSEFALQLESHGRTDAGIVSSLVLACIVGTVSFYGLLSGRIARWLGLAETRPRGVLFVGATRAVREIAAALHELGVPSVLVDTNLANIQEARRLDLRAWHGSILSDRCLDEVDLTGIGCLCAMTASDEVNLLTMRRARGVFEGRSLYQLPPRSREDSRFGLSAHGQGRWLFGPTATSEHLEVRLARGARVTATQVTEPAAGRPLPGEADLLLFALQPDGSIAVATADAPLPLRPGCMVVAIVEPAPQPELPKSASAPGRT